MQATFILFSFSDKVSSPKKGDKNPVKVEPKQLSVDSKTPGGSGVWKTPEERQRQQGTDGSSIFHD